MCLDRVARFVNQNIIQLNYQTFLIYLSPLKVRIKAGLSYQTTGSSNVCLLKESLFFIFLLNQLCVCVCVCVRVCKTQTNTHKHRQHRQIKQVIQININKSTLLIINFLNSIHKLQHSRNVWNYKKQTKLKLIRIKTCNIKLKVIYYNKSLI